MNREIKFKVFDNVDYMSNPFTLQDIQDKKIQFTKDCILMRFTGLLDKNGVEIYEGDLLHRHLGVYWEVRFTNSSWIGHPKNECGLWLDAKQFSEAEIIGNVYEHPHLLK